MLNIYSSSRTEELAQILAEGLVESKTAWNEKEVVLVQGKGMERWLSLQLAEMNGISGHIDFAFPKSFVTRLLKTSGCLKDGASVDRDTMAWQILDLLPELEERESFSLIKNYVVDKGNTSLRRYQLAMKLADIFDNYFLFRPEMIHYWSQGSPRNMQHPDKKVWDKFPWQAELWQALFKDQAKSFTQALLDFTRGEGDYSQLGLPQEINLFGFSTLSPIMIQFFKALSELPGQTVNFYLFSPCEEYWADTVSEKKSLKAILKGEDESYWEAGQPLLASMGILGRDFQRLLLDEVGGAYGGDLYFAGGEPQNLLEQIQQDVRTFSPPNESKAKPFLNNKSLIINSCHSPQREVEVLYDQILDLLDGEGCEALLDANILVMAPNIKDYAPYIDAVFGSPERAVLGGRKIPFTIADGSLMDESQLVRSFMSILSLVNGRLTSQEVLSVFESEVVYKHFGLKFEDLSVLQNLIKRARICWGEDGAYRKQVTKDGVEFEQNSWRFGLNRLLMGYAMPEAVLANDHTAIYPIELADNEPQILGQFLNFVERIFKLVKVLKLPARSGMDWQSLLNQVLEDFLLQDKDTAPEVVELRKAFGRLPSQLESAAVDCELDLAVVMSWLNGALSDETAAHGFLQRGITFCKLLPMRSIPAKVICILGMNDGIFPRIDRKVSFDLVATDLKPGDRSARKDDRYLFLETLMAARETLYLSYVGRSIKDNSELPPSVLVSELLDYVELRYGDDITKELVIQHPLQPFNVGYFSASNAQLFSYSHENGLAAKSLIKREVNTNPFQVVDYEVLQGDEVVFPKDLELKVVELDDLLSFFKNPSKFYLNRHLKVYLNQNSEELPDEVERFEVAGGLEGYGLKLRVFESLIQTPENEEPESFFDGFQRQGELPVGELGRQSFDSLESEIQAFYELFESHRNGLDKNPLTFEIDLGGVLLRGRLDDVYGNGTEAQQLCYHIGNTNGARDLRAKILQAVAMHEGIAQTQFIYKKVSKKEIEVKFVKSKEAAFSKLKELVSLYLLGQTQPLVFMPESSTAFFNEFTKLNKDDKKGEFTLDELQELALGRAMEKWEPGDYNFYADASSTEIVQCFGRDFPGLKNEYRALFVKTACAVYEVINGEQEGE